MPLDLFNGKALKRQEGMLQRHFWGIKNGEKFFLRKADEIN